MICFDCATRTAGIADLRGAEKLFCMRVHGWARGLYGTGESDTMQWRIRRSTGEEAGFCVGKRVGMAAEKPHIGRI